MKKIMLIAIVLLLSGCGDDSCCPKNDKKQKSIGLASGSPVTTQTSGEPQKINPVSLAASGASSDVEIAPIVDNPNVDRFDASIFCCVDNEIYNQAEVIINKDLEEIYIVISRVEDLPSDDEKMMLFSIPEIDNEFRTVDELKEFLRDRYNFKVGE